MMRESEKEKIRDSIRSIKEVIFESKEIRKDILEWEKTKDEIIDYLNFDEEIDLIITQASLLTVAQRYLYYSAGFGDVSLREIVNTKGTTELVQRLSAMADKEKSLRKQYSYYFKKFNKEYQKRINKNNSRR